MKAKRTNQSMLGYNGCEIMTDEVPGPDGEPMTAYLMRIHTVQAAPGGKSTQGVGPWIFLTVEALDGLAVQLTDIVASIKKLEAGADPDTVATADGVTVTRLPDGPAH
ncbi:hypothetical protein [Roseateles sp. P5_E7]